MPTTLKVILCAVAASGTLVILLSALRQRRLIRYVLLTVLSGVAALFAVNALGAFTGISLPVNGLSLGVSAVGGTPGVISLLLLNTLFTLVTK
ncbi:MAG: pro-sigmaK processing inhibitor BofA family protein [Oscillospiraceae bacterium]|jgi:hypothetical protein|nr:pro-sigmaK processing inhibitor BofA family protein [Oscillospiraceae bacterium]